ncbi:hypothetical protein PVIIG_05445 [Plasmodium vivax India VII]|uniref:Uncharacterized protein n=1 Tax=Plasmodium vivax India VII TaxID=1077284 RepID=A0A0J9S2T9_PLAVI|nr:hypothetical protein PVIIG_05445 [Plasmodium vivax India VII]
MFTKKLKQDQGKHDDFCMKLIRNLKEFCKNGNECKHNPGRCIDLNNWIYNQIRKKKFDKEVIRDIFVNTNIIFPKLHKNKICSYYPYDEMYKEPLNIILLYIFGSNMHIIKETLMGNINSIHCSCQKYVDEGVKIYKYMNNQYCSEGKFDENKQTCSQLQTFSESYKDYLINEDKIRNKIPSLISEKQVELIGCDPDESIKERQLTAPNQVSQFTETNQASQLPETNQASQLIGNNQENNSRIGTVTTALATMAGMSSLFALSYRVNINSLTNMKNI